MPEPVGQISGPATKIRAKKPKMCFENEEVVLVDGVRFRLSWAIELLQRARVTNRQYETNTLYMAILLAGWDAEQINKMLLGDTNQIKKKCKI